MCSCLSLRVFEYSEFRDHSLAPATSLNRERLGDFSYIWTNLKWPGAVLEGMRSQLWGGAVLPGLSIGGGMVF